jgi:isopenicillin N synthase-like dioxygenase
MPNTAELSTTAFSPETIAQAARDILENGYAIVKLGEAEHSRLDAAVEGTVQFFTKPAEFKNAHASADYNYGYRPFGVEYSITPDRPDVNECFTLWGDRLDKIPDAETISDYTGVLSDWRDALAPLVRGVLDQLARSCGGAAAPDFRQGSYLQINYYLTADSEREMLQDRHEDGHMVTVIHPTRPGLEAYIDGEPQPVTLAEDEVLMMPGSVLTLLSGGTIQPLYHQVRNLGLADRRSIIYFVNPELDEPLFAWQGEDTRDICEHVRNMPASFGLPQVETL